MTLSKLDRLRGDAQAAVTDVRYWLERLDRLRGDAQAAVTDVRYWLERLDREGHPDSRAVAGELRSRLADLARVFEDGT